MGAKAVAVAIVLIIILIAGLFLWWYVNAFISQQKLIDRGCTPKTFGILGIATSWKCP
jgi:hypothetical protein